MKWYRKIAELFIDISIYNSNMVRKKMNDSNASHLAFRQNLIKTIVMFHINQQAPNQPGRGKQMNNITYNPLRLIERHFLSPKNKNSGSKHGRCVRCNHMGLRKDVIHECSKCNVSLCWVPCLEIYHT